MAEFGALLDILASKIENLPDSENDENGEDDEIVIIEDESDPDNDREDGSEVSETDDEGVVAVGSLDSLFNAGVSPQVNVPKDVADTKNMNVSLSQIIQLCVGTPVDLQSPLSVRTLGSYLDFANQFSPTHKLTLLINSLAMATLTSNDESSETRDRFLEYLSSIYRGCNIESRDSNYHEEFGNTSRPVRYLRCSTRGPRRSRKSQGQPKHNEFIPGTRSNSSPLLSDPERAFGPSDWASSFSEEDKPETLSKGLHRLSSREPGSEGVGSFSKDVTKTTEPSTLSKETSRTTPILSEISGKGKEKESD